MASGPALLSGENNEREGIRSPQWGGRFHSSSRSSLSLPEWTQASTRLFVYFKAKLLQYQETSTPLQPIASAAVVHAL